jgi:anti-sigma factor RsiW
MHLNLDDLLAVRDGHANPDAVAHAASCPECAAEVARLSAVRDALAALPDERPSRDLWEAIVAGAAARQQQRRLLWSGWVAAGLAAAFTVAIGVRGAIEAVAEAKLARETQALVSESQRLERALHTSEGRARLMNGRTAGTVAQLEDRIAYIDARLSRSQGGKAPSVEAVGLWQERVRLLDALVSVETSGTTYVGL